MVEDPAELLRSSVHSPLAQVLSRLHVWLTPVRAIEPVPGRVHLDVRLDVDGDLDRLVALGATRQWEDPKGRWAVLADPEGNLFCAMYPAT